MPALHHLSAAELSAAYANGSLSPVEVVHATLARMAAWEPRINAMYRIDAEKALAVAKASESR